MSEWKIFLRRGVFIFQQIGLMEITNDKKENSRAKKNTTRHISLLLSMALDETAEI